MHIFPLILNVIELSGNISIVHLNFKIMVFITVSNKSHLKTSKRLGRGSSKTLPTVFPF